MHQNFDFWVLKKKKKVFRSNDPNIQKFQLNATCNNFFEGGGGALTSISLRWPVFLQ